MLTDNIKSKGQWGARLKDANGNIKWEDNWGNKVVDEALEYTLGTSFLGLGQISDWYIGITDASPTPDGTDTMSDHPGWEEVEAYQESERPSWTPGVIVDKTVDNSIVVASFTGSENQTIVGGAFMCSSNVKGGDDGLLFSIGAFSNGNKSMDESDTLEVTVRYTASSTQ